jgi:hypothetical protein
MTTTTEKTQEPKFVRRIGLQAASVGNAFGLCDDGNVWLYGTRLLSNCGPLAEFLTDVHAGRRFRCLLDNPNEGR